MQEKFIEAFQEALEREEPIELTDQFRDYDEWDSLSRLSLIAMLDDEFEMQIEDEDFEKLRTVADLMEAVRKTQA